MQYRYVIGGLAVFTTLAWFAAGGFQPRATLQADDAAQNIEPEAVESDMHEFMEYAFQPTYLRLKESMAAEPADNSGWKAIKSDSLILAEGGNLLLLRQPDEDSPEWNEFSGAVRDLGGQLYAAAKMKNFGAARTHYQSMLKRCNACHDKFAGGEHQLEP